MLLALPAGASMTLPADNDRSRFRKDGAVWDQAWELPQLLNSSDLGDSRPANAVTDLHLHAWELHDVLLTGLLTLPWELQFTGAAPTAFLRQKWWLSYAATALYLVSLWGGGEYMKNRKPFDLKRPLAVWNLALAVFSFIGMIRVVSWLLVILKTFGWSYTLCRAALPMYGNGPCGLWVALFTYSKYAELLDTAFLVLRKKKVSFLHWYHHCSVLMYCWHATYWEMPSGIYFVAMNYSVHAIMYFYYFLAGVCKQPPKWALFVTTLQLSQMAVGIAVTVTHLSFMIFESVDNCDGYIPNLNAALGMYSSYFALFAHFLLARYCKKRDKTA
jgi:hypothetical protein